MIPESTVRGEEMLRLVMHGHLHFQSLWAGVALGIFDILAENGPLSVEQLGEVAGLAHQPARIVLANLCALGLIERRGDAFGNGDVARRLLVSSSPDNILDVIRWQARIVYPGIEDYVHSLRANTNVGLARFPGPGRTLYERLAAHPELEKVFQDAMTGMPSNRSLAGTLPIGAAHHICDCGGGTGRNAIALARAHPRLRVTIFDRPTVCAEARKQIEASGVKDRIDTHEGDFLEDPFPTGIDAVLYSHIASIWRAETNVRVFRRAREALPVGGRFFIFNMVASDDHTGPLSVTCGSVYFHALATGEGFMHSARDYSAMLLEAGFADVEIVRGLPVSHALVIATKQAA
jgi:hypothetical protein